MEPKRSALIIIAALLVIFFVSTSSGLADLSAIQDQLRNLQLKIIGEKIKLISTQVKNVPPPAPAPESVPTKEELADNLKRQIQDLQDVIKSLKPKYIEEETARIDAEVKSINAEIKTATGQRLLELQDKLQKDLDDYNKIQQDVASSLEDTIKQNQVTLLEQQIKLLQQKIQSLPPTVTAPAATATSTSASTPAKPDKAQELYLQDQISKAKLKLLQAQIKAVSDNILKLMAR